MQHGSTDILLRPVPGDFFRLAVPVGTPPAVELRVGGILASCAPDAPCTHAFDTLLTPNVTSVSPTTGPPGTEVTVIGSGFSAINATILAGSLCGEVISLTDEEVMFTIGDGPAGLGDVFVFGDLGASAGGELASFSLQSLAITSVDPPTAPVLGGGTALLTVHLSLIHI